MILQLSWFSFVGRGIQPSNNSNSLSIVITENDAERTGVDNINIIP